MFQHFCGTNPGATTIVVYFLGNRTLEEGGSTTTTPWQRQPVFPISNAVVEPFSQQRLPLVLFATKGLEFFSNLNYRFVALKLRELKRRLQLVCTSTQPRVLYCVRILLTTPHSF